MHVSFKSGSSLNLFVLYTVLHVVCVLELLFTGPPFLYVICFVLVSVSNCIDLNLLNHDEFHQIVYTVESILGIC